MLRYYDKIKIYSPTQQLLLIIIIPNMFKFGVSVLFAALASAFDSAEFSNQKYLLKTRGQKSDAIWSKIMEDTASGGWHLA